MVPKIMELYQEKIMSNEEILKKECLNCSKEFGKNPKDSYVQWKNRKFCSSKCAGIFNHPPQFFCEKCGKRLKRKRQTKLCLECLRRQPKSENWKEIRSKNMMGNQIAKGLKYKKEEEYLTPKRLRIRMSNKYKEWRKKIFERDNYTCQICGKRGCKLHADHIKRFSLFPELRFVLSNGRTLCVVCHQKTKNYGNVKTNK